MDTFSCPGCRSRLIRTAGLQPGDAVQCPRCRTQFDVPPEGGDAPARPPEREVGLTTTPSPPRREDHADEAALPRPDRDVTFGPGRKGVGDLTSRYAVELGRWWSLAARHYGAYLGGHLGFALLFGLIALGTAIIPCVGALAMLFVLPPLSFGSWVVALQQLRGRRWEFGDFFRGFDWFGAIVGYVFLQWFVILGSLLPLAGAGLLHAALASPRPPLPAVSFAVFGLGGLTSFFLLVYFGVRLCTFAPLLIVDRNLDAVEAMHGSWRLTEGKVLPLFSVYFVLQLLLVAGYFACVVGLLFALPMVVLVWTAAYLHATEGVPRRDDDEPKGW